MKRRTIDQVNLPLDGNYNFESTGTGVHAYGSATGTVARGQRVDFQPLPVLGGTTIDVILSGSGDPDLWRAQGRR